MLKYWRGQNVGARALRSSTITILNTVAKNGLRLVSNLILTRLLFPEAFGLMALVMVFLTGLSMFSDIGLRDAIIRQKTDDRVALNTLWTLQIVRGGLLWVLACAIAWPVSVIYDEPDLLVLLPVVGLTVLIEGFRSTKGARAVRDLTIGRLISLELAAQVIGLIAMALLAWWLQSIWALALGQIIIAALRVLFIHYGMPGPADGLGWDTATVWGTLGFGVYIFFATIASYFVNSGSQMLLGAYVSLSLFGIFSIATNFATLPNLLAMALSRNVLFPLYRLKSPVEQIENQRKLFLARRLVGLLGMAIAVALGLVGDFLIRFLFDPRYEVAGPILVLMALASLPKMAFMGTQQSLIAHGDTRRLFLLTAATAVVQMALLVVLLPLYGVAAAILVPALSVLITYPLLAAFTARYKTWDATGEIALIGLAILLAVALAWIKADAITSVFALPIEAS